MPLLAFGTVATSACAATKRSRSPRCAVSVGSARAATRERAFWVEAGSKNAFTTALECGVVDFVFHDDTKAAEFATLGRFQPHVVSSGTFEGGRWERIAGPSDVEAVCTLAGVDQLVVIDPSDWNAIPSENIIAAFQATPTRLYAVVSDAPEAEAMLAMLEVGVDGVVLRTNDGATVRDFTRVRDEMMAERSLEGAAVELATVRSVRHAGVGERVCVDTCSLLDVQEGLLVGSSSQCLGLVLSEAAECAYISSRPFRVNAGAVHMYVAVPGGKTKYLCELAGGDLVQVYNAKTAKVRTAVVGRAKVETRPLTMAELEIQGGKTATMFLQNAETVRVATDIDGEVSGTSVAALKYGDRVVVRVDSVARHIGLPIDEKITEK